jgi:hypothetical protein
VHLTRVIEHNEKIRVFMRDIDNQKALQLMLDNDDDSPEMPDTLVKNTGKFEYVYICFF